MTGGRRPLVEVARGVLVATSRRYATTSTVLLDPAGDALVVDPAWDADELAGLPRALEAAGATCVAGLATHVHYDHVLWHPDLGDVPRWSSPWTSARLRADRARVLAPLVGDLPDALLELAGRLDPVASGTRPAAAVPDPALAYPRPAPLPDPYELRWGGGTVLLHEHDAHAPAHLAVEVTSARVLLAGDMLSDVELPMPDEANPDLAAYLAGLDRLAPVVARVDVLVPGHGTPTTAPLARLDADRGYLDAVLSGRQPEDPRIGLPDMADLHRANVERARRQR